MKWLRTLEPEGAIRPSYRRPTACRIRDAELVQDLFEAFGLGEEWSTSWRGEDMVEPVEPS